MKQKAFDVLIVGAGAAGLTSAAYLSRENYAVLMCEASDKTGGLVGSFETGGYVFDSGIRAFENSGIIFPMLKDLGIHLDVVRNPVSIGIDDRLAELSAECGLENYRDLLIYIFPDSKAEIIAITEEIKKSMEYMEVLYGIENPLFGNVMKDKKYLLKTLLPWLIRYRRSTKKVAKLNVPIYAYLSRFTDNMALIDMIAQHFFEGTPASFALSYFSLYLDYSYPVGGMRVLAENLTDKVIANGGTLCLHSKVVSVDVKKHVAQLSDGQMISYKKLIWACNMASLYDCADTAGLNDQKLISHIEAKRRAISDAKSGDSILSLFLAVNSGKETFEGRCTAHNFYTPNRTGLSGLGTWKELQAVSDIPENHKDALKRWITDYLRLTTYEISIPVLRDTLLAPPGKTGVIISTLFDYELVKAIHAQGWYTEFKDYCTDTIIDTLDRSSFPLNSADVTEKLCSTPLTIERLTGNMGGAVTGWAFTNNIPAVSTMQKVMQAVNTPLPDIYQAGHWSFSPSGLPIAILTGKLAADTAHKKLNLARTGQSHDC